MPQNTKEIKQKQYDKKKHKISSRARTLNPEKNTDKLI
jgi:hypothetical protein